MSNHTCLFLKNVAFAALCCMGAGLFAAATDGTWIQPLDSNYNMSTAAYWQHATVANGGGSVRFINQGSNRTKTLSNNVGTLTWNNVDLGASVFTLAGQPVVITGDSILTATSTTGVKFTNEVSFASGATVTKRGVGTVTFYNKVSAPSATLTLAEGKLVSTAADAFLTDAALNLRTGLFEWRPAAVADADLAVTAGALAYGPDRAHIKVTKGNAASYALTFVSLARVDGGFLDLQLTGNIDALGETEKFLVSGRSSDSGFIDASVISRGAGAVGDAINFLVYDAEKGFVPAETAAFVEGQAADGKVAVISSDTTISQDTAVSALLVENGAELTIASGVTLTVGDGVHPAGVIWRATSLASGAVKNWHGPGTLAFKAGSAGYFYYNGNSTQNSASWTKTGRLYLKDGLKITGTAGVTFAGAANAFQDYGTVSIFSTDNSGWTGGTSVLGTRLQFDANTSGTVVQHLSGPVRVLGDAAHGFGGQIRQNYQTTLAQDFTLGGTGVQLSPTSHSGFFNWGGSPYVTFDGRITLANDAAMNHDNKPSTADKGSLTARGGITGPGDLTLNWNAYLDLAGPSDYTGKTILAEERTGLFITGPNGTPGLGPVVSKTSQKPVVTFRRIDGLVASNDFTSIGGAVFTAVTNISFLGAVDFAKAEFSDGMTLGCGTNTVNFGVIGQSGINVTAAADGGALTVGREGTDIALAAQLVDGAHGERLGLVKTTSDMVTLYPGTEASTYTGPTSVRAGTLRLSDDPFESGSVVYWLDADDASTIVTDGDGRVTRWTSKAGIAGLAFVPPTGSASYPYCGPTVSEAAINGRNAVMFEADAEHYPRLVATNTVSGGGLATVDQKTVFILTRPRKAGLNVNNTFIFFVWNGIIGQRLGAAGWDVRGPNDGTGETFDTTHGLRLDGVQRPEEGVQWNSMYLYNDAFQQILTMRHEHDFVVVNSYGTYNGVSRFVPSIGGGAKYGESYSRSYHGDIAEVIAFNRVLSEAEMQRVENYLAEKWGITEPHAELDAIPTAISSATTLSVAQDATFDLNGVDATVAGLEGYGLVTNSSEKAATLTVTDRNAFAGTVAGNVTLVDKSVATTANCAMRGGASLVMDGGRTSFGLYGDMPVTNGIAFWVDASHPETVQTNAEGQVTNWTCRAGTVASFRCRPSDYAKLGGQNYTYTAPERYDEAAFNGKPAVYFGGNNTDGTNHMVSSSTATMRTLFLVCKVDGKAGGQEGFLDVGSGERGIMVNTSWSDHFGLRPYTSTTYHKYGYLLHVIGESVAYDYTFATATGSPTYFDVPNTFILSAQCDETSGAFSDYQNKTVYLGRGYHRGVRAWFGEVIGYERLLSEAEVADVEAYLKNKWFTVGPAEGAVPALAEDTSVSIKNGGTLDLDGAAATVDSISVGRAGGSFLGDVTLTGNLPVDFEGAQTMPAPLTVDGDLTLSDAGVVFLNYTNIVTDTWHDFLTATGTATGDFASDNLSGPYRRKKAGSTFSLAHLTGMLIIFR